MDKRVGKSKLRMAHWSSTFTPGQAVTVKHCNKTVPATLIRKRIQPEGTWWGKKQIDGVWTKEVVITEWSIVK